MKGEMNRHHAQEARPFQAGLMASMRLGREGVDADYIFGITEIDEQHEELESVLIKLQEAMDHAHPQRVMRPVLELLHEKLKPHFALEEAVMHLFAHAETQEHCRAHGEIIELLENHINANPTGLTWHGQNEQALQRVCERLRSHDARFLRDMNLLRNRLLRAQDTALS